MQQNIFSNDTIFGNQQTNIKSTQSNMIKCSFAEINDLSSKIEMKGINTNKSKYKFGENDSEFPRVHNCTCSQQENSLQIVSRGGTQFTLPLEHKITRVFPLNEGILIEFHVKHELKFSDVLTMSKLLKERGDDFDLLYNEENLYSYVTLNRHPLNPLKILGGIVRKNPDKVFRWYRSQERIVYVSKKLPIAISYNIILQRHAIHYIRVNIEERIKDDTTIRLQNNFYSLNNIHNLISENPEMLLHSNLLTDMIFEETNKENVLDKCKIIQSQTYGEILVFMLISDSTSYVKIYSLDLLNQNYDNILSTKAVKKVSIIEDVKNIFSFNLLERYTNCPKIIQTEKKSYKNQVKKHNSLNVLLKKTKNLKSNILMLHNNDSLSIFLGWQNITNYHLNFSPKLQRRLKIAYSSYGSPTIENIHDFRDQKATIKFYNGTEIRMNICPKIDDYLVASILKTLSYFFHDRFFERLNSDIMINCFGFECFEEKKTYDPEYINKKEGIFGEFLSYFIFTLKLCNKNGLTQSEDYVLNSEEKPSKKIKSAMDTTTDPNISTMNLNSISSNVSTPLKPKEESIPISSQNWTALSLSNFHINNSDNFESLFEKKVTINTGIKPRGSPQVNMMSEQTDSPDVRYPFNSSDFILPRVSIPLELFYSNRIKILRILHLFYQEMKISKLYHNYLGDMAYFLYCFSKYINNDIGIIYCDYYIRENPEIIYRYKSDSRLKRLDELLRIRQTLSVSPSLKGNLMNDNIYSNSDMYTKLEKDPPDIFKWIQSKLNNQVNYTKSDANYQAKIIMPIGFKLTSTVCKFFEILCEEDNEADRLKQQKSFYNTFGATENRNPNFIRQDSNLRSKNQTRTTTTTSMISDLFAKPNTQNVTNISNNSNSFELSNKFEQEYPLFYFKIYQTNEEAKKFSFDYKNLKEKVRNKEEKIFLYLIKKKISLAVIDQFAFGISCPIYEVLRLMRLEIPPLLYEKLPKLAFKLIRRDDLYRNLKIYGNREKGTELSTQNSLNNLSDTINNLIRGSGKRSCDSFQAFTNNPDKAKNHNDHLFKEVTRLLETTKPMRIKPKHLENIPEDKIDIEGQNVLQKICIRRFSVLVGQGAYNFGTLPTLITEVLKIPKINLSAFSPPNDTKITFEIKDEKEHSISLWPEFHNGVATGLKLFKEVLQYNKNHLRTWIFYQRPETPKYEHGGFILAMGLLGFLDSFMPTDVYQYLKPAHDATSVGILLGLAASRIGKMDENTSKTLCLHIPHLIPPTYDIEISINVQTAAIVGIGLLHKGTSNRVMTEMTLAQIGRRPISDKCLDRDGYSLASGYALGLINLSKGTKNPSIKDLDLDERLIRFVEGGKPMDPPKSMLSTNYNVDHSKCSSVKEGNMVNTHITAPAALVALALIYLKSNRYDIANRITIANSFSSIENCNPNHILLKIVTKNLIIWDKISNTTEFIYSQIPDLIKFIFERNIKEVYDKYFLVYNVDEIDFSTVSLIYVNIIAGCVMSMGLKYAGTGDRIAFDTIVREIEKLRKMKITKCELANDQNNKNAIDNYNLSTILCVCLLSLSLIMAGTCDIECLKWCRIIRKRIEETSNMHFGFNMAVHMAIGFLFLGNGSHSFTRSDLSIASLFISIYPHFPTSTNDNKYHLQALRHLYVLAAEPRLFYAVDVETNKLVNLNLELEIESKNQLTHEKCQTPLLIQESKKCLSLRVLDEEYYNVEFHFRDKTLPQEKILFVKKRVPKDLALPPIDQDPNSKPKISVDYSKTEIRSLTEQVAQLKLANSLGLNTKSIEKEDLQFMLSFNDDITKSTNKSVNLFDQYNTKLTKISSEMKSMSNQTLNKDELLAIYHQLLKEDRIEFYPLYLVINSAYQDHHCLDSRFLQNLNIIIQYYLRRKNAINKNLYQSEVFAAINFDNLAEKYIEIMDQEGKTRTHPLFKAYLDKLDATSLSNNIDKENDNILSKKSSIYAIIITLILPFSIGRMLKFCVFMNLPSIYDLGMIKTCIMKFKSMKTDNKKTEQNKELTNEEKYGKIASICQLYLYISYPLCPNFMLNAIANHYLS